MMEPFSVDGEIPTPPRTRLVRTRAVHAHTQAPRREKFEQ